jgi:hypothetical protein
VHVGVTSGFRTVFKRHLELLKFCWWSLVYSSPKVTIGAYQMHGMNTATKKIRESFVGVAKELGSSSRHVSVSSLRECRIPCFSLILVAVVFSFHFFFKPRFFWFVVAGPPRIADVVEPVVANVGDTIRLPCPIDGEPAPFFEWFKVNFESSDHFLNQEKRCDSKVAFPEL